jgi:hypothetical protein
MKSLWANSAPWPASWEFPVFRAASKKIIGTQMNADFQDSIKPKNFFGVYLRKSAAL